MAEEILQQEDASQQEEKLQLEVLSLEDAGVLKKKLTVKIPEDQITKRIDQSFSELAMTAQIPGFRIGRAPRKLIEKKFAKEVREQVRNVIVSEAIDRAIEEQNLKIISPPEIDIDKIELPESGDLIFSFDVEISPEFDLPEYEGIKLIEEEKEITDKDIDDYIESVLWQFAELKEQAEDKTVEKNDHLDVDYVLEIEGNPPIVKHNANIRAGAFAIEGILFENLGDELSGLKVGEEKEITINVPDDHKEEAIRGKKASLKIKVKKIYRWIKPELNEDFVKKIGFDSIESWKEAIATELEARQGQQTRRNLQEQVKRYLLDNTKIDLPEGLTDRATESTLARRVIELQQMGFPAALIEQKLDELRESAKKQAVDDLKLMFIINKIAEKLDMTVSEDEANSLIASMAFRMGRRPERLKAEMIKDGRYDNIINMIKENKVIEYIIEKADIEKVKKEDLLDKSDNSKRSDKSKSGKSDKQDKSEKKEK